MNEPDSLHNQVEKVRINRFGGCYTKGKSYSPERIAECVNNFSKFRDDMGRDPTLDEFMISSKIGGRDLALKILHHCKYNLRLVSLKKGHRHAGPLSRVETFQEGISLDLYLLYLDWRSRPIRSYKNEIKAKYNLDISEGIISKWFHRNKRFKGVFVKLTCSFSDLKFTEENVIYYNYYTEKIINDIYHNNITFTDEKSFILHDLLKLRVRKDPITGEVLNVMHGSGVNIRKRYNIFCTIRPFNNSNCNKTLMCVITEKNGTAELFQRYVRLIIDAGFLVRGDIAIYDNASIHVNGVNSELQSILSSTGIDAVLLSSYSPELNPIELVFNVMA